MKGCLAYLDDGVEAHFVGRIAHAHAEVVLNVEHGLALSKESIRVFL